MADNLPLLFFPNARRATPEAASGFPPSQPHFPTHNIQAQRLKTKIDKLQASINMAGLEPETVLVIEIIGRIENFKNAIDRTGGLEWMGEWDIDDIEADDNFYEPPTIGVDFFKNKIDGIATRVQSKEIQEQLIEIGFINHKGEIIGDNSLLIGFENNIIDAINQAKNKPLSGRLFLSFSNQQGMQELLSLFKKWQKGEQFPMGQTKWRDVFTQIRDIRKWGIQEALKDTRMVERWNDDFINHPDDSNKTFQIELFYRSNQNKRSNNEDKIKQLLQNQGGEIIATIDKPEIAFHAVKAKLPTNKIRDLLDNLDSSDTTDIELFNFSGIMYCYPTGQNISTPSDDDIDAKHIELTELPKSDFPPIVAILDGVPNTQHIALKNRLLLDDPDNLSATYQTGKRGHGTAMASLVIHGDLSNPTTLTSNVYHLPVMQYKQDDEGFPDEIFFEDRIERAVRRIFEGEGDTPAQAPHIKIINISLGDPDRLFIHFPSPWARLLDYLSDKYQVLFCVSAGNYVDDFNMDIPYGEFSALSNNDKNKHIVKCISKQLSQRRLLSPAESLNSLTIGALNMDDSSGFALANNIDLLPDNLFSPLSRFGYGFRNSIKPEIYFAGGKQLYISPHVDSATECKLNEYNIKPGQQVAADGSQQGELSQTKYTAGTSNACALATHSGARIYEVLSKLQAENNENIDDELMAVLIKALLVHGAKQDNASKQILKELKTANNSRVFKKVINRYLGYGSVDIERVLACTEQRGTVLGSGKIKQNETHEYIFPIPYGLSGEKVWRSMTITLAWFSPINTNHRNLRQAKLSFEPPKNNDSVLNISRIDSNHHIVNKGTVQHEILTGKNKILAFQDNEHIKLHINCKKDAIETLDKEICYGLAVTLELEDGVSIDIYNQIKNRIQQVIQV
ncbi:MAG: S8 family peptidase [Methylococcales symbiont of Hymedesmia sp. n. MRB-2018]|nr:MAG: S8 family peptidase [Methylococcales symbiont of Hymedesmia sp. n. MRB-2018]